jgi:hypothetical protein
METKMDPETEAEKKEALKAPGTEEGMTYDEVVDDSFPASDPPPHSRDADSRQWADVRAGQLRQFFENYAAAVGMGNLQAIADAFADVFIAAGPKVRAATANDALFLATLAEAGRFYQQLGIRVLKINTYEETQIDLDLLLVKIEWQGLDAHGAERVRYDTSYLVQTIGTESKIVLMYSHNEQSRLREQGLIESPA